MELSYLHLERRTRKNSRPFVERPIGDSDAVINKLNLVDAWLIEPMQAVQVDDSLIRFDGG